MAPKKKTDTSTGDEASKEGAKFSWTAENERKLLLFTHPFLTVSTAEFEKLLEHFPGTNMNGIKIRYSRLRVEKNKLAEEYGFTGMGSGGPAGEGSVKETPKKTTARGKKRGGDAEDGAATPAKKGKKSNVFEDEEQTNDLNGGVKAEIKAEVKEEDEI